MKNFKSEDHGYKWTYTHSKFGNHRRTLSLWKTDYIFFLSIQGAHFSVDQWEMNNNNNKNNNNMNLADFKNLKIYFILGSQSVLRFKSSLWLLFQSYASLGVWLKFMQKNMGDLYYASQYGTW